MAKEFSWDVRGHKITATQKGNKYILYLDDDHLTNVYRLHPRKMRYGMEESITVLGETCLFVVWEEIPDLVVDGKMLHRDVDCAKARENRRQNMESMYTVTAVFGLAAMAVAFVMLYLGMIGEGQLRVVSALLSAGVWMVVMGLYYRGKWIEQIP